MILSICAYFSNTETLFDLRFPSSQDKRELWLKFLNKKHGEVLKNAVLCSRHFATTDFGKSDFKTILNETAVPTKHTLEHKYSKILSIVKEEVVIPKVPTPSTPNIPPLLPNIKEEYSAEEKILQEQIDLLSDGILKKDERIVKLEKDVLAQKKRISKLHCVIKDLQKRMLLPKAISTRSVVW